MKKSQHFSSPWWWGIASCYEIQNACKALNVLKWSTSVSFHFITIVLKISEIKYKIKKSSKTQLHEVIPNLFRWDKRVVRCSAKPEKRCMKMNCSSFAVFLPQSAPCPTSVFLQPTENKKGFISKCLYKKN